ncbi:S-layer homology domain-containing protein [Paenibacillus sp. y28]|uniref:S-layer homology domain-containing protein n=1 Tax=Paenibacillus sp. y28 TaxID=3129110 RepID=UPI003017D468
MMRKSPFKKAMCSVCLVSLLVSAAPVSAALASAPAAPAVQVLAADSSSALKDGVYSMNYTIKKFGTNQDSVMQGYVLTPGQLTVKQGKYSFSFTLKQSKEITALKTEVNGALKDVEVVGTNAQENTRTVQFEVDKLNSKLKAWVKIEWAAMNYFHEYDIELVMDADSAKKIADLPGGEKPDGAKGAEAPQQTEGNPAGKPGTAPAQPTGDKPTDKPDEQTGSTAAAPASKPVTDLNGHWAKEKVEQAIQKGIANGYDDGTFLPNGAISRAEFAVLLSRALKLQEPAAELSFADAGQIPSWAVSDLQKVVGAGILGGYEDNTFRPDRNITRSEIAVTIVRTLGLLPAGEEEKAPGLAFADAKDVPEWAEAAVAAAFKAGIISGKDNNRFDPAANATRAEAVSLVLSLLEFNQK